MAARVRASVFGKELGYVRGLFAEVREIDPFDTLETTRHVLLYAGDDLAGAARLLLPSMEVARGCGTRFGLAVESSLELTALHAAGATPAETTRVCVLPQYRNTPAMAHLHEALFEESRRHGVTHWVACANAETDSLEDARILLQIARARGHVETELWLPARKPAVGAGVEARSIFDDEARERARRGDVSGLRLPPTLSLFTRTLGARVAGEPLYDGHFHMCSIPIVLPIARVSAWLSVRRNLMRRWGDRRMKGEAATESVRRRSSVPPPLGSN
ncbi:MAG: GNAT family N-acetyltransferase [Polyangiaceae bacterium]